MNYAEIYPHLAKVLNIDNFECLAQVIDTCFADFFQLEVLNHEAETGKKSSYWDLFTTCVAKLSDLYSAEEMLPAIYDFFQDKARNEDLLQHFSFVPSCGQRRSKQLGFLEKLAVGDLRKDEPLSFLDMRRFIHGGAVKKAREGRGCNSVKIYALKHLAAFPPEALAEIKENNDALVLNLNLNLKGVPKWGILDLKNHQIYCESCLTEAEKASLEQSLGLENLVYHGGTANSLISSGYTALAWLDENITKVWNFNAYADLASLRSDVIFLQFAGDSDRNLTYSFSPGEKDSYLTQEFSFIVNGLKGKNHFNLGCTLSHLVMGDILGVLNNQAFGQNDLSSLLKAVFSQNLDMAAIRAFSSRAGFTSPPGFAITLGESRFNLLDESPKKVLGGEVSRVHLSIPSLYERSIQKLSDDHRQACSETATNAAWFDFLPQSAPRKDPQNSSRNKEDLGEFYAVMMVLTLLRSRAKKSIIEIDLPNAYQLNRDEITFSIQTLDNNPFVTELDVALNASLNEIKKALIPSFARNRWLAFNHYKPPLMDDFWKQAANYWVTYLLEKDELLQPKKEYELFKNCVQEMGVKGLDALLHLLNDQVERSLIETLYGQKKPAFYVACQVHECKEYFKKLIQHLSVQAYFPFGELGLAYHPQQEKELVTLFNQLNRLEAFEKVTLTDCMKSQVISLEFLERLTQEAKNNHWVFLIAIPELDTESKDVLKPNLRAQYTLLNDIILGNRHRIVAKELNLRIQKASRFSAKTQEKPEVFPQSSKPFEAKEKEEAKEEFIFSSFIETLSASSEHWPLKRGIVTQLQLQQQQQIEQSRQIQKEHQRMVLKTMEDPLSLALIDYKNIDQRLGAYLKEFCQENLLDETAASLKTESESLLQGFFHTWINANPEVLASQVIEKMTQDAAIALLHKHVFLTSGLNPANLPKGFYTQRTKDGALVLCYNPELGHLNIPNPLTLKLDAKWLPAETWQGDFRQVELEAYLKAKKSDLNSRDWENLAFFAAMQPPRDYATEYDAFCAKFNPSTRGNDAGLKDSVMRHGAKIKRHWVIFDQLWQYLGTSGVRQFIDQEESRFELSVEMLQDVLLEKQAAYLQDWVKGLNLNPRSLQALGQIYHLHGHETLMLFLTQLKDIEEGLGVEFFHQYLASILLPCENFNAFIEPGFFAAMNSMIEVLRPQKEEGAKRAWQAILSCHMHALVYDKVETLWRGFEYFKLELTELGLELEGHEFDGISPRNMLVCLDRVLASIRQIPDINEQKRFLGDLKHFDLNHGGVHYALVHEEFKHFDDALKLHDFHQESKDAETYAPKLVNLYRWGDVDAALKIRRALAAQKQFNYDDYQILAKALSDSDQGTRDTLVWLLNLQYEKRAGIGSIIEAVSGLTPAYKAKIAAHLHQAIHQHQSPYLSIQLEALMALEQEGSFLDEALLNAYPQATLLEALSILYQAKNWDNNGRLIDLFIGNLQDSKNDLQTQAYKLAALFSVFDAKKLQALCQELEDLKPVVRDEFRLLMNQLFSIDYDLSELSALRNGDSWQALLACIKGMKKDLANTPRHRIALIESLSKKNLHFKYTKAGDFRALQDPQDRPSNLSFFVDHQERLWKFMQAHLLVPTAQSQGEEDPLKPTMLFFKRLQLNRTYLNELEPLLASCEETVPGAYWSVSYFNGLLRALQPESDEVSFPISLLKVLLKEPLVAARPIERVEKNFPQALHETLQDILKNTRFNRANQAKLCQLAVREFSWMAQTQVLQQIAHLLASPAHAESQGHALELLIQAKNSAELERNFANCSWFLQHHPGTLSPLWKKTSALWLKALSHHPEVKNFFETIQADFAGNQERQALILEIIAHSSLKQGLRKQEIYEHERKQKTLKLVKALGILPIDDLRQILAHYPGEPEPHVGDLLQIFKRVSQGQGRIHAELEAFSTKPQAQPRVDYAGLLATREADLQRMIAKTTISSKEANRPLSIGEGSRLTLVFGYLKQLEDGRALRGYDKPIAEMTPVELAAAFKSLSKGVEGSEDADLLKAELWALLFEALGRATGKYPHLAQQFALIANDLLLKTSAPHLLQLATGEGKSHFVALRAARYAGLGKSVDVCTAKRSLATRDLEDYQDFFELLGLKAAYIHPKSAPETYQEALIHYSTLGDLSLFFDEQSYLGQPLALKREERVALFDEFDFIYFEEGRKTEYNYARPTGKTPKQMTWFYQAVNEFYSKNQERFQKLGGYSSQDLGAFIRHLQEAAGDHEEKLTFLASITRDKLHLVQWLQAAHEAHELQWGGQNGFTVREVTIEVGDETYPMREIIPLSADNQPMFGSTFSGGVHQLLAVRLNTEAKGLPETAPAKKRAQNFHIHPESRIISSQIAAKRIEELWSSWEGFSGTISHLQAAALYQNSNAEVLHVPTNQLDLRHWHKPSFYQKNEERQEAMIRQVRLCLQKNQSILFSCKNDRQVTELETLLKTRLTKDELSHFIFYTNEEEKTPQQVLTDKREQEAWLGGKKQKGMALVASGFGRGDNVGVEAVFLLDINDDNDRLQKGGRTARNGEAGEVFQFYLEPELRQEEQSLLTLMKTLRPGQHHEGSEPSKDSAEACFKRVLDLREQRFNLETQANQAYRKAIAYYSSWGLQHLARVEDINLRQELATRLGYQLKNLDKYWVDLSSKEPTETAIANIAEAIIQEAQSFVANYKSLLKTEIEEFSFSGPLLNKEEIITVPAKGRTVKEHQVLTRLSHVMLRLFTSKDDARLIIFIPRLLAQLFDGETDEEAKDKHGLRFIEDLESCANLPEFYQKLDIAVAEKKTPSKPWQELLTVSEAAIESSSLYQALDAGLKKEFFASLRLLLPNAKTQVLELLQKGDIRNVETRVEEALSLIKYLGSFYGQESLQEDYLVHFESLQKEIPQPLLTVFLSNLKPMSYKHFLTLWSLGKKHIEPLGSWTILINQLQGAIEPNPEQRLRLLTKWESWAKSLLKEQAQDFLLNFSRAMTVFKEGQNWDLLEQAVENTHDEWNKGAAYQPTLLAFWQNLSHQDEKRLATLTPFLHFCFDLGGKAKFELFNQTLDSLKGSLNPHCLSECASSFKKFWNYLLTQPDKKYSARLEIFKRGLSSLECFYSLLDGVESQKREAYLQGLKALDGERFAYFSHFIEVQQERVKAEPDLMFRLLGYLNVPGQSLDEVKLLEKALIRLDNFKQTHAGVTMEALLSGLDRFKSTKAEGLNFLLELFVENRSVHVLFDDSVFFLVNQKVSLEDKQKVLEVIQAFYQAGADHQGKIPEILNSDPLKKYFAFAKDETAKLREQRLIFMHLLHRSIFVANEMPAAQGYAWNGAIDQNLEDACFKAYQGHIHAILAKKEGRHEYSQVRDLSHTQQESLVELTEEFKTIGTELRPARAGEKAWTCLKGELDRLGSAYQASWFKSSSRALQAKIMHKRIMHDFARHKTVVNGAEAPSSRYEQVLNALHRVKKDIIAVDLEENKSRWLNLHRNGQSRLYKMLNEMQESVMKHWCQDLNEVQGIHAYQRFNQREFIELVKLLEGPIRNYDNETYDANNANYHNLSKRFTRFFSAKDTSVHLQQMIQGLVDFEEKVGVSEMLKSEDVRVLMDTLKAHQAYLPGYLSSLVNEALAGGDTLQTSLAKQEDYKELQGALAGG